MKLLIDLSSSVGYVCLRPESPFLLCTPFPVGKSRLIPPPTSQHLLIFLIDIYFSFVFSLFLLDLRSISHRIRPTMYATGGMANYKPASPGSQSAIGL
jgi:hypothetical protein